MKNTTKKTQTMTATQARKHIFEILDAAYYQGIETTITKYGKDWARVMPPSAEKTVDWGQRLKELQEMMPILTDEDVEDYKKIRAGFNKPRFPDW
jgi:prevent-host-death family protein